MLVGRGMLGGHFDAAHKFPFRNVHDNEAMQIAFGDVHRAAIASNDVRSRYSVGGNAGGIVHRIKVNFLDGAVAHGAYENAAVAAGVKGIVGSLDGQRFHDLLLGHGDDIHAVLVADGNGDVFAVGSDCALVGTACQFDLANQFVGGSIKDAESVVTFGSGEKARAVGLNCHAVDVGPDLNVANHL